MGAVHNLERFLGKRLARILPTRASRAFVVELSARDPQTTIGESEFRLVERVCRLVHLERVR